MWRYRSTDELCHYGVKGMKWGVRRTREQLRHDKGSIMSVVNRNASKIATRNGILVTSIADHAGDQAHERKITSKEIVDALQKPLYIKGVKVDDEGRKSQQFIGSKATVCVNPDTGVISPLAPS